jgi:GT2 family glycosyltransferase
METVSTRRYREPSDYLRSYRAFIRGEYEEAAGLLETLCKKKPGCGAWLNDLGVCRYLTGDTERSRKTLERAVRADGEASAARVNLFYLFHPAGFTIHDRERAARTYRLPEGVMDLSGERVSIILLEYNNPELTLACLRSLNACSPSLPFEVILIDNSEGEPAVDYRSAAGFPELRYRKNPENTGFARGCNQGASLARGSLLYFVNNDTLFREGAVEELARVLVQDSKAGIAGSRLLYRDETIQHAGIVFTHLDGSPEHRCRHGLAEDPAVNIPLELQAVTGASLMIRSDLFRELGGFSETFRNGYEDLDLCLKAGRAGFKVVYNPRSVLTHLESMSRNRTLHEEANLRHFRDAWGDGIRRDELDCLGRNENFLLSYTDHPGREKRQRQLLALCARLIRNHPGLPLVLPLPCIEFSKQFRLHRFSRLLFFFLLEQGQLSTARSLYRSFLLRQGYRTGTVRDMRQALRQQQGTGEPDR